MPGYQDIAVGRLRRNIQVAGPGRLMKSLEQAQAHRMFYKQAFAIRKDITAEVLQTTFSAQNSVSEHQPKHTLP